MDTLQNTTVVGNDDNVEEQRDPLVDKLREAIGNDVLSASEISKRSIMTFKVIMAFA